MVEIIPRKNFNDNLWDKYFNLSQEIVKRHYPDGYNPDSKISEFKDLFLKTSLSEPSYNDFIILENGNASAWLDSSVWENTLYAKYDFISDNINEKVFRTALKKLLEINNEIKCSYIEFIIYREILINYLISINTPVSEEMLFSRLNHDDMDISLYNEIIENSELKKWNIRYLNEIPDEFINEFVDSVNKCLEDKESISKNRHHYPPLTPEEWYKDKMNLKTLGTNLEILILFDDNNKIAGFCWVCIDSFRKNIIRHNGGFTAVNSGYRGKGIAKYLKAKLYTKLLEENSDFRYISTDTMPWNTYMYRINEEFGFKPYKKGCSFKLTNDFIKNYLNL